MSDGGVDGSGTGAGSALLVGLGWLSAGLDFSGWDDWYGAVMHVACMASSVMDMSKCSVNLLFRCLGCGVSAEKCSVNLLVRCIGSALFRERSGLGFRKSFMMV